MSRKQKLLTIFACLVAFYTMAGFIAIPMILESILPKKLAEALGTNPGDEIIIRYTAISNIPADAPFAPEMGQTSKVLKIGAVIDDAQTGNFSLSVK